MYNPPPPHDARVDEKTKAVQMQVLVVHAAEPPVFQHGLVQDANRAAGVQFLDKAPSLGDTM